MAAPAKSAWDKKPSVWSHGFGKFAMNVVGTIIVIEAFLVAIALVAALVVCLVLGGLDVYHRFQPTHDGGTVYCGQSYGDCEPVYEGGGKWDLVPLP